MSKKIVNTYQVSFAKSLDISKDYKSFNYDRFKRISQTFSFKVKPKDVILNEDFIKDFLELSELNFETVQSELTLKLEEFKELFLDFNIKILLYNDGSLETVLSGPQPQINTMYLENLFKDSFFKNWIKFKLLIDLKKVENVWKSILNTYIGTVKSRNF